MLYLFLYFVCCKLPHGKFTNSKTATETKYNTSETIGFARKAEQTPIIHYSFYSSYRRDSCCSFSVYHKRRNSFLRRYKCMAQFIIHFSLKKFGFENHQITFEHPKPLAKPMRTYPQKRQL